MTKGQEEREKALETLRDSLYAPLPVKMGACPDCCGDPTCDQLREDYATWLAARDTLRDCIPVPREEYDRLRRALLYFMKATSEYGTMGDSVACFGEFFESIGFARPGMAFGYRWTPAAHEFAESMRKESK